MNSHSYTYRYDELSKLIKQHILPVLPQISLLLLEGPLGAGKTTFTQHLLAQCGVQDAVVSPTFAYVKTYSLPTGRTVHHFDLYRLQSTADLHALGLEELLFDSQALVIVEWPEVIALLLNRDTYEGGIMRINLAYGPAEGVRSLHLEIFFSGKKCQQAKIYRK